MKDCGQTKIPKFTSKNVHDIKRGYACLVSFSVGWVFFQIDDALATIDLFLALKL